MKAPILEKFHVAATGFLFAGHRWHIHAWEPFYQAISQRKELPISPVYAKLEVLVRYSVNLVFYKATFSTLLGVANFEIGCVFSRMVRSDDVQICLVIRDESIVDETGEIAGFGFF